MITFYFENGAVATLRGKCLDLTTKKLGSGTEPKLKYYVELNGADPEATRKELGDLVENIIEHFLKPDKYPLIKPTD
jgi:phosphomannomutase